MLQLQPFPAAQHIEGLSDRSKHTREHSSVNKSTMIKLMNIQQSFNSVEKGKRAESTETLYLPFLLVSSPIDSHNLYRWDVARTMTLCRSDNHLGLHHSEPEPFSIRTKDDRTMYVKI